MAEVGEWGEVDLGGEWVIGIWWNEKVGAEVDVGVGPVCGRLLGLGGGA